jgi:signal peptidase
MGKAILKACNTMTTILVAIVVLLAILLVGPRAVGMQVFVVLSGSMEPTYHTGSIIYVKDVDPMTLQEGDPVTFRAAEDTIVTHRIIEVIPDEENPNNRYFRTKGDANEVEDGGVTACDYIVGKPVFTVPQLGYLAAYIQEPPGIYVAISAAAGMMLLVLLIDSFTEDKEAAARKEEEKKAKKLAKKQAKENKET